MEARRFRTDFFVVDSHYEEEGIEIDGGETVSFKWVTPSAAIAANAKGEMPFLPPQYFVLSTIQKYGTIPSQITDVVMKRSEKDAPLHILPHPIGTDGNFLQLTYPGDEEHCEYPGRQGSRHRLKVPLPMGKKGGFHLESTLSKHALTIGDWEKLGNSKL
jgi:hypothetical protein